MTSEILGLGNDIIEIPRLRKSFEQHGSRLLDRLFTKNEQDYCFHFQDPIPHFSGRFAAKEAISKALGTGFGKHLSWLDIEILGNAEGKPEVHLTPTFRERFPHSRILVSISHCENYATATALWTSDR